MNSRQSGLHGKTVSERQRKKFFGKCGFKKYLLIFLHIEPFTFLSCVPMLVWVLEADAEIGI